MDINQEYQDKIDQYLLGRMSEQDRLAFEQELNKDQELSKQFEFTKNVKDAIVGRSRRLSQIQEWEQAYEEKKKAAADQIGSSSLRYIYWISGIAAFFIAGFFLFQTELFDTKEGGIKPVSVNVSSLRGGEDNTIIANLINEGNYNSALEQIGKSLQNLKSEKRQTEQDKANIDEEEYIYLKEVIEIQMDELKLLKAYALMGLKQTNKAIEILDELRKGEGQFQMQADSLYNELTK